MSESEAEKVASELEYWLGNDVLETSDIVVRAGNAAASLIRSQAERIRVLEAALKPFADAEASHGRHVASGRSGLAPSHWTNYDDFRAARAAMEPRNG